MNTADPPAPLIIAIDEIAVCSAITGLHTNSLNEAAAWLLAEFDDFDPEYTEVYDPDADEPTGPACVQPMFTLKTDMEPGVEMRVSKGDYADHDRWWL